MKIVGFVLSLALTAVAADVDAIDQYLKHRARRSSDVQSSMSSALRAKNGGGSSSSSNNDRRRVPPRADGAARFGDTPVQPKKAEPFGDSRRRAPFGDSRRRAPFGDSRRRAPTPDYAEINAKSEANNKEAAGKSEAADKLEASHKESAGKIEAADKVAQEQSDKAEAADKEAASKEAASKEAASKEAASKEAASKEAASKEASAKEQSAKESAAKAETASKEQAQKEQAAKEAYDKSVAKAKADCGPGYYYTAPFACDPCLAGTYQGGWSQTSCKDCRAGSASPSAAAACTDCVADVNYAGADRAAACVAVRSCAANGETAVPGTVTADRVCHCSKGHAGAAQNPSACTPCAPGDHAPSAGATECTPCAVGSHAATQASHACAPCVVNDDALDATHGFAKNKGERQCTKHRVCTPPTEINGVGEYQTKPASPSHDRECAANPVCHEYQFIAETETATSPRQCEACPYAFKAVDDFSGCYAYMCTHLQCKHVRHSCHAFNINEATRIPTTRGSANNGVDLFDNSVKNECDGTKLFQTTVTRHDEAENTCNADVGHWCGMGVVSGDMTRCECAPLNLKPANHDKGLASTPDELGWTGHSDELERRHPDDSVTRGFAGAGTPNARDRDAPVEYLGTKVETDHLWH